VQYPNQSVQYPVQNIQRAPTVQYAQSVYAPQPISFVSPRNSNPQPLVIPQTPYNDLSRTVSQQRLSTPLNLANQPNVYYSSTTPYQQLTTPAQIAYNASTPTLQASPQRIGVGRV